MLDKRDMEIINMLKQDARISVSSIAKTIGISNTAVKKRINKLEKEGIITGYTIKLNEQILGERKALLILHVSFDNFTTLLKSLINERDKCDSIYYRSSSNAYMFYILLPEKNAKYFEDKFGSMIKNFCPITLLEKLV